MSSYEDPEETGAADDVDMAEAAADEQVGGEAAAAEEGDAAEGDAAGEEEAARESSAPAEVEWEPTPVPTRTSFATYLSSPVVTLVVGGGEGEETKKKLELTAHQGLLTRSPYFATLCGDLGDVSTDRASEARTQNG